MDMPAWLDDADRIASVVGAAAGVIALVVTLRQGYRDRAGESAAPIRWGWVAAAAAAFVAGTGTALRLVDTPLRWAVSGLVLLLGAAAAGRLLLLARRPLVTDPGLRRMLTRQWEEAGRHTYQFFDGHVPAPPAIHVEQLVETVGTGLLVGAAGVPGLLSIREVLRHEADFPHVLVVSGPGMGKSTLVAQVLREQSRWWLDARRGTWPSGPPMGPVVPVALPARLLAGRDLTAALIGVSGTDVVAGGPPAAGARWLIVIDGLDEVLDPHVRSAMINTLGGWLRDAPSDYRFLVTTRPLTRGELTEIRPGKVGEFALQPFSPAALETFAGNWFAPPDAALFLARVSSARLRTVVSVPLLATIAAIVFTADRHSSLPSGRAGLYERFVEQLVDGRPAIREQRDDLRRHFERYGPDGERAWTWLIANRRALLAHLADAHLTAGDPVEVLDLERQAVHWVAENAPSGSIEAVRGWRGHVRTLLTDTGVLTLQHGRLVFTHRSLAEYLAAEVRGPSFERAAWLSAVRHPDTRNLALFVLVHSVEDIDELVTDLLGGGDDDVIAAGDVVADGIEVGALLHHRVVEALMGCLAGAGPAAPEALRVLLDLAADEAVRARLATLARSAGTGSWVRVLTAAGLDQLDGRRSGLLREISADGSVSAEARLWAAEHLAGAVRADGTELSAVWPVAALSAPVAPAPLVVSTSPPHDLAVSPPLDLAVSPPRPASVQDLWLAVVGAGQTLSVAREILRDDPARWTAAMRVVARDIGVPGDLRVPVTIALAEARDDIGVAVLYALCAGNPVLAARWPAAEEALTAVTKEWGSLVPDPPGAQPSQGAAPGGPVSYGSASAAWGVPAPTSAAPRPGSALPVPGPALPAPASAAPGAVADPAATDPAATAPAAGVRFGVPPRNPRFTGRDDHLARLGEIFAEAGGVVTLHGISGVGKTQLAAEYLHRSADRYYAALWIPAEDPESVITHLLAVAQQLDLPIGSSRDLTVDALFRHLGATEQPFLIVYDNAAATDTLEPFLTRGARTHHGHVIVTTRDDSPGDLLADDWEVGVFSRPESLEMLGTAVPGLPGDDADRLAARLGDLPLALDQAASWFNATGMAAGEYLELIDEQLPALLAEGGSDATTAATFALAVDKLATSAPEAVVLLRLAAHLGAAPLSLDLLRRGRRAEVDEPLRALLNDPLTVNRAARELRRYGLARVEQGRNIALHRLIRELARHGTSSAEAALIRRDARLLLITAGDENPVEPESWPVFREMADHVEAAGIVDSADDDARALAQRQCRFHLATGEYEQARHLAREMVRAWEPDHRDTLAATALLGAAVDALGDHHAGRELTQHAHDELRKRLGAESRRTLAAAQQLGHHLRVAGDGAAALKADEDCLLRHVEVFGPEATPTLEVRRSLSASLRWQGSRQAAQTRSAQTARLWVKRAGEHDYRTVSAVIDTAWDMIAFARFDKAERTLSAVLPALREALGTGHDAVLVGERAHAVALLASGRPHPAIALITGARQRCHARFGAAHQLAVAIEITYLHARRRSGRLGQMTALSGDVATTARDVLGESHPYTLGLAAAHVLARDAPLALTRDLLHPGDAGGGERRVIYDRMAASLGEDHPDTCAAANAVGNELAAAGRAGAAADWYYRAYRTLSEVLGKKHPRTRVVAVNLTAAGGGRGGSPELLAEALGSDHPDVLAARRGERLDIDIEPPPV